MQDRNVIWNTNKAVILWVAVVNRNLREQFSGTATEGLLISRVFLSDPCAISVHLSADHRRSASAGCPNYSAVQYHINPIICPRLQNIPLSDVITEYATELCYHAAIEI